VTSKEEENTVTAESEREEKRDVAAGKNFIAAATIFGE